MPAAKPKLLDEVRIYMRTLHYSRRTEDSYCEWMKRFILFHGKRHPRDMGEAEVGAFLSHLAVNRNVAASTQNQALSALLLLYGKVLGRPLGDLAGTVRAKTPQRRPLVLTRAEVEAVLGQLHGERRLVGQLLYGSGLRLLEALRLRVQEVDFGYRQITVRDGKGAKDRVTMLPEGLAEPLRRHLEAVRRLHARDVGQGFCVNKGTDTLFSPRRRWHEEFPDEGRESAVGDWRAVSGTRLWTPENNEGQGVNPVPRAE